MSLDGQSIHQDSSGGEEFERCEQVARGLLQRLRDDETVSWNVLAGTAMGRMTSRDPRVGSGIALAEG